MNFQRYLSAKRTVDDRALNPYVEDCLARTVAQTDHLRVLEVGAGIGATVERLLAKPWLPDRVTYTALDLDPENLTTARRRLPARAMAMGYSVRARDDRLVCTRGRRQVELDFVSADAFEFLAEADAKWDLLVAQAFVDLVNPQKVLETFRDALTPEGVAYCPITFDGETIFEPVADPDFEAHLAERFHAHIDESGDSEAGRHLLATVSESDSATVLAVGGSDWVVRPRGGEYPADEAYFLHCIVDVVARAVRDDPEVADHRLTEWTERRHDQIDDATLLYCTHQLDVLFGRR